MLTGKLAIVSNRLPIRIDRDARAFRPSIGGLATALRRVAATGDVTWYGWPGEVVAGADVAWVEPELAARRLVPIHLTAQETTRYYDGFANGVIWPLFHYLLEKVNLDAENDWREYVRVNERFADVVAGTFDGNTVWVHDYHLAILPRLIRARAPEKRVGFFLHVPFPSEQVFRVLPWREQLLLGMLGADVIGFQTAQDAHHFVKACVQVLGVEFALDVLSFEQRQIRVGAYPIGVDARSLARDVADEAVQREAAGLRADPKAEWLMLGVDRLDYTKGIRRHILALAKLFERDRGLASKIKLVQVAAPTRGSTPAYAAFRRELHELVGRINATFGTLHQHPIHLLERTLSPRELLPLYAAADVMLVTPNRDGMNLVAKEYVACRHADDGVLVLSEFAGAAAEMTEALVVNPNDLHGMAATIERAMHMPAREKKARMQALRRKVFAHDVDAWCDDFLNDLASAAQPPAHLAPEPPARVAAGLQEAPALIVMLAYDGTLLPHATAPELAAPDEPLVELLAKLAARPRTRVAIVSGRTREELSRWLGHLEADLFAEHGFFQRIAGESRWTPAWEVSEAWKDAVRPVFAEITRRTVGTFTEEKVTGIAWHHRSADAELAAQRVRELRERLEPFERAFTIEIVGGAKVLEARVRGVGKRIAASRVLLGRPSNAFVVAVGDDWMDEELFRALPPDAISIHVGGGPSCAAYRVGDSDAVRAFLQRLVAAAPPSRHRGPP